MGSLTVEPQDEEEEMGSYLRTIYVMIKIDVLFCKLPTTIIVLMVYGFSFQVISAFLLIPLSIALGVLLGWHIYLILQNKTTIEVVLFLFSLSFFLPCLFISSIARLWISLALVRYCSSANQFFGN